MYHNSYKMDLRKIKELRKQKKISLVELSKMTGIPTPEEMVEKSLRPENLKIETRNDSGKWEEVDAVDIGGMN